MKKISSSFLKSFNWLLTSVLMLLGFSTCDSEPGAAMCKRLRDATFAIYGGVNFL